jgi:hypothetical protein
MDYKWKGTAELIVGIIIGSAITWGIMEYKCTVKQYGINLIGENMYTQLDDLKHANMIKEYLEANPNATRKDLSVALHINYRRLMTLNNNGIITLPHAIPFSQRNKPKIVRL